MQATDAGSTPRRATASLLIRVQDVNDHSPVFGAASYTCTLVENSAIGTTCSSTAISATDSDGTGNVITYSLQNGFGVLTIDPDSGVVSTIGAIDYEEDSVYDLVVVATDSGTPTRSTPVNLRVAITDVNDNAPVFDDSTISVSYPEDTNPGGWEEGKGVGVGGGRV